VSLLQALAGLRLRATGGGATAAEAVQTGWAVAQSHLQPLAEMTDKLKERLKEVI